MGRSRALVIAAVTAAGMALGPPGIALAAAGADSPAPNPSHPSLDILLRPPRDPVPGALRVDLPREELPPPPAVPGALEGVKDRIRLERRSDPVGVSGPRQGTHSETDAGLRVPLDADVSLEGGVRVEQRDDPGAKVPERKSTPRVGVEVRF